MAAVREMVSRLSNPAFCAHVQEMGEYLRAKLEQLVVRYPDLCIAVRGKGLINGLVLTVPPRQVVDACFAKGVLVASAGSDVLRFVPPLVVEKKDIDAVLAVVDEVLATL
jgi:acetylornithine/succinyldiaminopimelate/putrescine aminotransferase